MNEINFHILKGKVIIVGIGNPIRRDDGIGPALVKQLEGKVAAKCIDAGSSPESYSALITREVPNTIVLVDAVHLNRSPGDWELFDAHEIGNIGLTTHDMPLTLIINYLIQQTKAKVYLLGVQPKSIALGEGLSNEVKQTLEKIAIKLREALNARNALA